MQSVQREKLYQHRKMATKGTSDDQKSEDSYVTRGLSIGVGYREKSKHHVARNLHIELLHLWT